MVKKQKCAMKRKLKFEYYKSCLEASQFDNKINYPEKNKIVIIVLKNIMKNS